MLDIPTDCKFRVDADNIKRALDILRRNGYRWISGRKLELRGDFQYTTIGLYLTHYGRVMRCIDEEGYQSVRARNEMSISQLFASEKPADISEYILSLFSEVVWRIIFLRLFAQNLLIS
jgi:hypothetical protein